MAKRRLCFRLISLSYLFLSVSVAKTVIQLFLLFRFGLSETTPIFCLIQRKCDENFWWTTLWSVTKTIILRYRNTPKLSYTVQMQKKNSKSHFILISYLLVLFPLNHFILCGRFQLVWSTFRMLLICQYSTETWYRKIEQYLLDSDFNMKFNFHSSHCRCFDKIYLSRHLISMWLYGVAKIFYVKLNIIHEKHIMLYHLNSLILNWLYCAIIRIWNCSRNLRFGFECIKQNGYTFLCKTELKTKCNLRI